MKYFRTRELNGLSGPMWGVEYTKTDGERWITIAVHNTPEVAEREMRNYVALHPEECAIWEGSVAQKIFNARTGIDFLSRSEKQNVSLSIENKRRKEK